jgi:hypothetical protein
LREQLLELLGSDGVLEVPDVKPLRHRNRPLQALLRQSIVATNRRRHGFQDN